MPSFVRGLTQFLELEAHALERLPSSMRRPADLVEIALQHLQYAKGLFGPIRILGRTEMSPVWRPLLAALKTVTDVQWVAGPRQVPPWVRELGIAVVETAPEDPEIQMRILRKPAPRGAGSDALGAGSGCQWGSQTRGDRDRRRIAGRVGRSLSSSQ